MVFSTRHRAEIKAAAGRVKLACSVPSPTLKMCLGLQRRTEQRRWRDGGGAGGTGLKTLGANLEREIEAEISKDGVVE